MPKGAKFGGRVRGTPNKATRDVREALARFAEDTVDEFVRWIREIEDPAKRADLYLRTIEYHIPKLTRSDLSVTVGSDRELTAEERAVAILEMGRRQALAVKPAAPRKRLPKPDKVEE